MNANNQPDKTLAKVWQPGCIFLFGGCFTIAGLFGMCIACVIPVWKSLVAQNWVETPCTIVSSAVASKMDSDGTSYAPEIHYHYSLDGGEFKGDQYSFMTLWSERNWAQRIVDRYPAGSTSVCYYNPKNPGQSVLMR